MSQAHRRDHDHLTGTKPHTRVRASSGKTQAHGRSQVGKRTWAEASAKIHRAASVAVSSNLGELDTAALIALGDAVSREMQRRASAIAASRVEARVA